MDLDLIREAYRPLTKWVALTVSLILSVGGLWEIGSRLYQINPVATVFFLIVGILSLVSITVLLTVDLVRTPMIWKNFRMLGMTVPQVVGPHDVKPLNKHMLFVDKDGNLRSREIKMIVNLDEERFLKIGSTFQASESLTVDDLNFTTNDEIIAFPTKLGEPYVRVDLQSKKKIRRYEPYWHKLAWTYKSIYNSDELNWFNLPAASFEGMHIIELSTEGMPITWFFGDELKDPSVLASVASAEKYVREAGLQPKLPQPVLIGNAKIRWRIRTPRSDRIYVLFFRYQKVQNMDCTSEVSTLL